LYTVVILRLVFSYSAMEASHWLPVRLELSSGMPICLVFSYGLYSHTASILISILLP